MFISKSSYSYWLFFSSPESSCLAIHCNRFCVLNSFDIMGVHSSRGGNSTILCNEGALVKGVREAHSS